MSKKPGIVGRIIALLKEGLSQSAISKELGVPRSKIQSVSDEELGVDPGSFKNLSLDDIITIQASEETNTALADRFNVNPKVIARAKKATINVQDKGVTSVGEHVAGKGIIDKDTSDNADIPVELEVGGFARVSNTVGNIIHGRIAYLAHYDEVLNMYLAFAHHTNRRVSKGAPWIVSYVKAEDLSPLGHDSYCNEFSESNLTEMASITQYTLVEKDDRVEFTNAKGNIYILVKPFVQPEFTQPGYAEFKSLSDQENVCFDIGAITLVTHPDDKGGNGEIREVAPEVEVKTSQQLKTVELDNKYADVSVMFLPTQVIVAQGGVPRTIDTSHKSYGAIVDALVDKDYEKAFGLMDPKETITKFTGGRIVFDGKKITWDGFEINHKSLIKRVSKMALAGDRENLTRFTKFMDKLFENPSANLVTRVFDFMVFADIEVDDDGDIIVYKSVNQNYTDQRTGKVQNNPGTTVRMPRSFVNDNQADLCSYGLHVCSLTYLRAQFGSTAQRVVRCKLNPRDIVSITSDFKNSKIRCCEYYVIDDITTTYNRKYKQIDMVGFYN